MYPEESSCSLSVAFKKMPPDLGPPPSVSDSAASPEVLNPKRNAAAVLSMAAEIYAKLKNTRRPPFPSRPAADSAHSPPTQQTENRIACGLLQTTNRNKQNFPNFQHLQERNFQNASQHNKQTK